MKLTLSAFDRRFLVVAKRVARVLMVLSALYVLTYAALSPFGAYAPVAWGLGKRGLIPKAYGWAPPGTYAPKTGEWLWLEKFYIFAIAADRRFWHSKQDPDPEDPVHPIQSLPRDYPYSNPVR